MSVSDQDLEAMFPPSGNVVVARGSLSHDSAASQSIRNPYSVDEPEYQESLFCQVTNSAINPTLDSGSLRLACARVSYMLARLRLDSSRVPL